MRQPTHKGVLRMRDVVNVSVQQDGDNHVIELVTVDRMWVFAPPTSDELNHWLALLAEGWERNEVSAIADDCVISPFNPSSPFTITRRSEKRETVDTIQNEEEEEDTVGYQQLGEGQTLVVGRDELL